jgi:copper(I)-binding protein
VTAIQAATAHRKTRRLVATAAIAAGAALTLSACGAGQISQTADQVAAVNGNFADVGNISLRNVHVVYPQSEEYSIEPGGKVELGFIAVNNSPANTDKLTRIATTAASSITLGEEPGGTDIAPLTALGAGAPADTQLDDPLIPLQQIVVELNGIGEDVRPGLTVPVTFTFENAGDVEVLVPVDAGPVLPRNVSDKSPVEAEAHGEAQSAEQSVVETQVEEGADGNN